MGWNGSKVAYVCAMLTPYAGSAALAMIVVMVAFMPPSYYSYYGDRAHWRRQDARGSNEPATTTTNNTASGGGDASYVAPKAYEAFPEARPGHAAAEFGASNALFAMPPSEARLARGVYSLGKGHAGAMAAQQQQQQQTHAGGDGDEDVEGFAVVRYANDDDDSLRRRYESVSRHIAARRAARRATAEVARDAEKQTQTQSQRSRRRDDADATVVWANEAVQVGAPVEQVTVVTTGVSSPSAPAEDSGADGVEEGAVVTGPCYGYFAEGSYWRAATRYALDTSNAQGLSDSFVAAAMSNAAARWNDALHKRNVFTGRDTTRQAHVNANFAPNGHNDVVFGALDEPGALAITVLYGVFSADAWRNKLVEFDVVFDDHEFAWGDAGIDPLVYDLASVAVHEFGHAAGMVDIGGDQCSDVTMYYSVAKGATNKRTLADADVVGVRRLHGDADDGANSSTPTVLLGTKTNGAESAPPRSAAWLVLALSAAALIANL